MRGKAPTWNLQCSTNLCCVFFLLGMLFSVTNEILRSFRENVLAATLLRSISGISAVRFSSLRSFALFCADLRSFCANFALVGCGVGCQHFRQRRVFQESHVSLNKGRDHGFTLVSQFALDLLKNVSKPWWGRNLCYVGGCRNFTVFKDGVGLRRAEVYSFGMGCELLGRLLVLVKTHTATTRSSVLRLTKTS